MQAIVLLNFLVHLESLSLLIHSLLSYFMPIHTSAKGCFLISSWILSKILNNYSIVTHTYTGIRSRHANQMHWFCVCAAKVIPYIKMLYSWFHKGQEKARKGVPEVRVTYLAIEYFRQTLQCVQFAPVKWRVYHFYIRNDNGSTQTKPILLGCLWWPLLAKATKGNLEASFFLSRKDKPSNVCSV